MGHSEEPVTKKRPKKKRKPKPGDPIPMPAWMFLPLSVLTVGSAFWLYRRGDPVAAAAVVVIASSAWTGFRMGLVRIVATVAALVAAIAFAPQMGMHYEDAFARQFGTTGLTNRFLCIGSIGVLISLVVTILVSFIGHRFLAKSRKLNWTNSLTGFLTGIVEGVAVAWLFLGGLLSVQMWQRGEDIEGNRIAESVDHWASSTRQSVVGPTIRDYNPFERIESLARVREYRKAVRRFSDPSEIRQLMDDQRIAELKSDPQIARAIEEIRDDPQIKELVEQGQLVDRRLLLRLMSSPGVMRLADDPEFIERVREIVEGASH